MWRRLPRHLQILRVRLITTMNPAHSSSGAFGSGAGLTALDRRVTKSAPVEGRQSPPNIAILIVRFIACAMISIAIFT